MSVTQTLAESHFMKEQLNQNKRPSFGHGKVGREQEEEDDREAELIMFDGTTQGLGLKICGGCCTDGTENFGIFVKRVLPGGLAATSGDIFCGDLILAVNGQSMQNVTYDRAVTMLRQASASNHVELVIARDADAQKEFADYMTKFDSNQSPASAKDFVQCSQLSDSDAEFQRKMGTTLKDSELDAYRPGEQLGLMHQGMYGDINGHRSSSSSCASEVANHMEDLLSPISNGSLVSKANDSSTDYLDTFLSRKLSLDPGLKLHIDQLESAIVNLGLKLSPSTQMTLRESLTIDQHGMVKFEDFVEVTKGIFQNELGALKRSLSPKGPHENTQGSGVLEEFASVVRERDQLKAEVAALKEELRNCNQSSQTSEEKLLYIRKHSQASIEEVRSLKSKLHLSEQALTKAQQIERDYEEVLAMFENEVSQLRLQMSKSDGVNMQKRLAVLVCQLKKAESGKKTYEVATEKLIRYVEHSLEVMASLENSAKVTGADSGASKASKKSALQQLPTEGKEVIRTVRSLMETVPLPFGWEEAYTAEGVKYYINHLNQTTTWTHPVSCMEHQTSSKSPPPPPTLGQQAQAEPEQPQQPQKQQPSPHQQTKLKHPAVHKAEVPQHSTHSKPQQEHRSKEPKQHKDKSGPHLSIEQPKQAQAAS